MLLLMSKLIYSPQEFQLDIELILYSVNGSDKSNTVRGSNLRRSMRLVKPGACNALTDRAMNLLCFI